MEIGHTRLTPEEREHRRRNGLCLYCGESGHLMATCNRRPQHQESQRSAGVSRDSINRIPELFNIRVTLRWGAGHYSGFAMIDSGAADNFIAEDFVHTLKIEDMGSTVAQWLALSPPSKKALGSNPGRSRSFQVLSVWSLHVLPVPAWVYSGYSGFPHHHKDMHCIV